MKNIEKYKIDAEQAEEQGGFVVFEEYAPEKSYDLTFGIFSNLDAAKAYADEIQRNDQEPKFVSSYKDYVNGDYDYLYSAK